MHKKLVTVIASEQGNKTARKHLGHGRTPILWPPDAKSQVTGKDPDAGKD